MSCHLIVPKRQEEERIRPKVCGDFFQAKKKQDIENKVELVYLLITKTWCSLVIGGGGND